MEALARLQTTHFQASGSRSAISFLVNRATAAGFIMRITCRCCADVAADDVIDRSSSTEATNGDGSGGGGGGVGMVPSRSWNDDPSRCGSWVRSSHCIQFENAVPSGAVTPLPSSCSTATSALWRHRTVPRFRCVGGVAHVVLAAHRRHMTLFSKYQTHPYVRVRQTNCNDKG